MLNTHKSVTDTKPKWSQKKEFTSGYLLTKNNAIPLQPLEPKDKYSFTWILNTRANPQVGISSWRGGHILMRRWAYPQRRWAYPHKWANPRNPGGHILIKVGKSSHEYNPNYICEIMGFVGTFRNNNIQEASFPETSISGPIVSEILAQLYSDDSTQILLNLYWV